MGPNDLTKRIDSICKYRDTIETLKLKIEKLKKRNGKNFAKKVRQITENPDSFKSAIIRQIKNEKISDLIILMERDVKKIDDEKKEMWGNVACLIKSVMKMANHNSIDLNKLFQYRMREVIIYLEGYNAAKGARDDELTKLKCQILNFMDRGRTYSITLMIRIMQLEQKVKNEKKVVKGDQKALKHLVFQACIDTETFKKEDLVDDTGNYKELVMNIMEAYRKQRKKINI